MENKNIKGIKLSRLEEAQELRENDLLPVVQDGETKKIRANKVKADLTGFYTKEEVDALLDVVKALTTGIKFNISASDFIATRSFTIYKAILNHNLNTNIENFSIGFYDKDLNNINLDYKIIDNNSIEIYSDEAVRVIVTIKQSVQAKYHTHDELYSNIGHKHYASEIENLVIPECPKDYGNIEKASLIKRDFSYLSVPHISKSYTNDEIRFYGDEVYWIYNVKTGIWTHKEVTYPYNLNDAQTIFYNNKIYFHGASDTTKLYILDTVNNTWEIKNVPVGYQDNFCAITLLNKKIHIVGGYDSDTETSKHSVYDIETDTWTKKANLEKEVKYVSYTVCSLINDGESIYLLCYGTKCVSVIFYKYIESNDTFSRVAEIMNEASNVGGYNRTTFGVCTKNQTCYCMIFTGTSHRCIYAIDLKTMKHTIDNIKDTLENRVEAMYPAFGHFGDFLVCLFAGYGSGGYLDGFKYNIGILTEIQQARGSSSAVNKYVGKEGQVIYNATAKTIHAMDGITPGGTELAKKSDLLGIGPKYIKTFEELKAAALRKDTMFEFEPFGRIVVTEKVDMSYGIDIFNGRGTTFVFNDINEGLDILLLEKASSVVKNCEFVSSSTTNTTSLYTLTGTTVNHRYAVRLDGKYTEIMTDCKFNVTDKIGLRLTGFSGSISRVTFVDTYVLYYLVREFFARSCVFDDTMTLIERSAEFFISNSGLHSSKFHVAHSEVIIDNCIFGIPDFYTNYLGKEYGGHIMFKNCHINVAYFNMSSAAKDEAITFCNCGVDGSARCTVVNQYNYHYEDFYPPVDRVVGTNIPKIILNNSNNIIIDTSVNCNIDIRNSETDVIAAACDMEKLSIESSILKLTYMIPPISDYKIKKMKLFNSTVFTDSILKCEYASVMFSEIKGGSVSSPSLSKAHFVVSKELLLNSNVFDMNDNSLLIKEVYPTLRNIIKNNIIYSNLDAPYTIDASKSIDIGNTIIKTRV